MLFATLTEADQGNSSGLRTYPLDEGLQWDIQVIKHVTKSSKSVVLIKCRRTFMERVNHDGRCAKSLTHRQGFVKSRDEELNAEATTLVLGIQRETSDEDSWDRIVGAEIPIPVAAPCLAL